MKFVWKGYGEIITAAVLWGTAGTLVRMISDMTALSIIFFRVTLAFIILLFLFSLSGNLNRLRLKDKKLYLLLFSLLQITTMLTFFISIMEASVAIAVLLLYTAPLYVTTFSPLLLKERSTGKGWMALGLSIAGVILIIDPLKLDISLKLTGIIAGMLSGVSYGFQIMISKHISKSYSGYSQAFWSFMIAMLLLLPFAAVPLDIVSGNIGYLILLAIFPTILAISLYFNGLNKVRAASASILGLIEPVSAVIFSLLILHESISIPVMLGGALILMGGATVTREP
ncbi:MAG: DMT family transporter [Euryarchaeota archaeon]|nr:DMT family transporter [Euryarchaeota archaeon]MBU4138556.1 DMT family transporter [Euryarchaeota archaeon]